MGGKKIFLGIVSTLVSISALITPANLAMSKGLDIKKAKEQRQQLRQKDVELKEKLNKTKADIDRKNALIKELQRKIEALGPQIRAINQKVNKLNASIDEKLKEIAKLEADIKEKMDRLMVRIRAIYKAEDVSIWDVFLASKDFNDALDKLDLVSRLSKYDCKLVGKINENIAQLNKDKAQLEEDRAVLLAEKKAFALKQSDLNDLVKQHEKALNFLNDEKAKEQSLIDENSAAYKDLQDKINKYYEEQARAQAEKKSKPKGVFPSGKNYAWPVPGFKRLSSVFMEKRGSYYHRGIDIAGSNGKSIQGAEAVAAYDGVVMFAYDRCHHNYGKLRSCGCGGGYGNYVFLDHGNGLCTVYGHLSTVNVREKQRVVRGQRIGTVGSTGHSTGPHLHFECRKNGTHYNPMLEYK